MKTVLLAAGFGSRLWPLSTSDKPKQFQQLLGEQSLLQYTYAFFRTLTPEDELFVLTLSGLEHWVYEQLPNIKKTNVLVVPERRNTLPHTLFALNSLAKSTHEQILFGSVDSLFSDKTAVSTLLKDIERPSDSRDIVLTLSANGAIDPSCGYAKLDKEGRVTAFCEKPDREIIEKESDAGSFHKNLFIYVSSSAAMELALNSVETRISDLSRKLLAATNEKVRLAALLAMPNCDISTIVFQHAPN